MNQKKIFYKITNKSPMIFPVPGGNPNKVSTLDYVPGSVVRGYAATQILRNETAESDKFQNMIISGKVCFGNAYLAKSNGSNIRLQPTPLSFKQEKGADTTSSFNVFDMLDYKAEENQQYSSVGFKYIDLFQSGSKEFENCKLSEAFHHSRNVNKKDLDNDIFHYQNIKAEQSFIGWISFKASSEKELLTLENSIKEIFKDKISILLGRSKTTQYGGNCTFEFIDYKEKHKIESIKKNSLLTVLAVSPVVIRDQITGQYDPSYFEHWLNAKLSNKLCLKAKYLSTEMVGGFNRKWGMPVPQNKAASTGSVWVFECQEDIDSETLKSIQFSGAGSRLTEGYGEIQILSEKPWTPRFSIQKAIVNKRDEEDRITLSNAEKEELKFLQKSIIRNELISYAITKSAEKAKLASRIPTSSTISRLRGVLRNENPATAISNLGDLLKDDDGLKLNAQRQLSKCRLDNETLKSFLVRLAIGIESIKLVDFLEVGTRINKDLWISENHIDDKSQMLNSLKDEIIVLYIDSFLQSLSKINSAEKGEANDE